MASVAAVVWRILPLSIPFLALLIATANRRKTELFRANYAPPMTLDGLCSIVEAHGYRCREYNATTGDGYVLTVHRIPAAGEHYRHKSSRANQPVLLQHGILMDGTSWLLGPPEQSLAILLADNGFDVWIANSRGTRWSRAHTSLTPDEPEYWTWSWDQLARYDLPSVVDLVNEVTGQKLHYIGHSLGTLIALASFSEHRLVDKVRSAVLLCPIAYLSHITTVVGQVAARSFIGEVTGWLGVVEFNPKIDAVDNFMKAMCRQPGIDCYDLLPAFTGKNCCLNASTVELFLQNEPQPTSTRNFVHLAQKIADTKPFMGTLIFQEHSDNQMVGLGVLDLESLMYTLHVSAFSRDSRSF